jgi:hypothetical protein
MLYQTMNIRAAYSHRRQHMTEREAMEVMRLTKRQRRLRWNRLIYFKKNNLLEHERKA